MPVEKPAAGNAMRPKCWASTSSFSNLPRRPVFCTHYTIPLSAPTLRARFHRYDLTVILIIGVGISALPSREGLPNSIKRVHFIHSSPILSCQARQVCPALGFMQCVLRWSPEKKVCQLRTNLPPKQALPLVQSSFSSEYIVNAILENA